MKKIGRVTVGELLEQLSSDSEYQAMMAEKEKKLAKLNEIYEADEKELVEEIRSLGYDIDSVWDFINNTPHPYLERRFLGNYQSAYPVLVKHLSIHHHPRIREGIVRALTEKDAAPVALETLLKEFYTEKDIYVRWALSNALKLLMPLRERKKNHPSIAEVWRNKFAP